MQTVRKPTTTNRFSKPNDYDANGLALPSLVDGASFSDQYKTYKNTNLDIILS